MALTEEELQGKRDTAADLQRQITEEKQKRAALAADKDRQSTGEVLDAEIERLQKELSDEQALTAHQESVDLNVEAPQSFPPVPFPLTPPTPPAPSGTDENPDEDETSKENS